MSDAKTEVGFVALLRQGGLPQRSDLQRALADASGEVELRDVDFCAGTYDCIAELRAASEERVKELADHLIALGADVDLLCQTPPQDARPAAAAQPEDSDYLELLGLREANRSDPEWQAEARYWSDWGPSQTLDLGEFDRIIVPGADELSLKDVPDTGGLGWKNDWMWIQLPEADPADPSLAEGRMRWLWRAAKIGWKIIDKANDAMEAYEVIHAGYRVAGHFVHIDHHPDPYEVRQRERLHAAAVRERLTSSGSPPRRAYFRLYYARIDRMQRISEGRNG